MYQNSEEEEAKSKAHPRKTRLYLDEFNNGMVSAKALSWEVTTAHQVFILCVCLCACARAIWMCACVCLYVYLRACCVCACVHVCVCARVCVNHRKRHACLRCRQIGCQPNMTV